MHRNPKCPPHLSDRKVSWLAVDDSPANLHVVGQLQTSAIVRAYWALSSAVRLVRRSVEEVAGQNGRGAPA